MIEPAIRTATIGLDKNIQATNLSKLAPSHYLVDILHQINDKRPQSLLELHWMIGYCGITGNKPPDEDAKRVARGDGTSRRDLPSTLRLTPTLRLTLLVSTRAIKKRHTRKSHAALRHTCARNLQDALDSTKLTTPCAQV